MAAPPRWKLETLELRCPEGHLFTIDGPDAHEMCAPSLPINVEREYEAGRVYFHISTIRLPMHCPECEAAKAVQRRGHLTLVKG